MAAALYLIDGRLTILGDSMADKRQQPEDANEEDGGDGVESDSEPTEPAAAELVDEEAPADVELPGEGDDEEPLVTSGHAIQPVSRSIARVDPLTAYINDIRRYGLLTREE